jgi:hypothetical protein
MGVYSDIAAEQLRESQFVENFHFTDLLEFAVNAEVANQRMFNAMIELDFHEAVEKMNGTYITEANDEAADSKKESVIKKLWEKVVAALKKFGEMIAAAAKKFANTLKDLVNVNKQITIHFGDLTAERLAKINTESVKDITFNKYVGPEDFRYFDIKSVKDEVSQFQTKIYSTKNENINTVKDECVEALNKLGSVVSDNALADVSGGGDGKELFKVVKIDEYIKDTTYIANVKENLANGYKKILSVYTDEVKSALEDNKEKIKAVDKDAKEAKKNGSDRTIAILNARYVVYNKANAIYAKFLRSAIFAARLIITQDRAAYCKLGALVLKAEKAEKSGKKQDQEVQHNNALIECYHIDLLNEQCIESIFE